VVMGKQTQMDKDASARIQSASDRHPESATAQSGFDRRAQSAAATELRRGVVFVIFVVLVVFIVLAAVCGGSSSPASDHFGQLRPWGHAFASLIGVSI
jgi:hypothetical protein